MAVSSTSASGAEGTPPDLPAALFRALVEHSSNAILLLDEDGAITHATGSLVRHTGYTPVELIGRSILEHVHPDAVDQVRARLQALLAGPGGEEHAEYRLRHKDGSWRWIDVVGSNLLHDPAIGALVVTLRDETERRGAGAAVQHAASRASGQQALDVRDDFLRVVAHELRTPLTSLKGHIDIALRRLERGVARDELLRSLRVAKGQADRLNRLVGELLDVSRLTSGRFRIDPERTDLVPLVERVVEIERSAEPPRQIDLHGTDASIEVEADAERIEQVLVNLLQNARKYSPSDSPIEVTLSASDATACVTVRDQGIGVPAADQQRVFEPFQRASNVDRSVVGIGLGLYIASEIVRAHGGTLELRSGPGAGSAFTVTLPRPAAAPREP